MKSQGGGYSTFFGYRDVLSGRGINFHNLGIRNGIKFHDFGITVSTFAIFAIGMGYALSENWYKVMYVFLKIGLKSTIHFGKIGIRNGYLFETSMSKTWSSTPLPWSEIPFACLHLRAIHRFCCSEVIL